MRSSGRVFVRTTLVRFACLVLFLLIALTCVCAATGASEEQSYDDGSSEFGFRAGANVMGAVAFDAPARRQIQRVKFFLSGERELSRVYVLDSSQRVLFSRDVSYPGGSGWFQVDLSSEKLVVQGRFYAGWMWLSSHPCPPCSWLHVDVSGVPRYRSYIGPVGQLSLVKDVPQEDGVRQENYMIRVTFAPVGGDSWPDLAVTDIVLVPTHPEIEDRVTVNVRIRNVGDQDAGAFYTALHVDAQLLEEKVLRALSSGASATLAFTGNSSTWAWMEACNRAHTMTATIDSRNQVDEHNEGNNTWTTNVSTVCQEVPLGETGGLHYVWWDFGMDLFTSLTIDVTIHNEPSNGDGLYFQMYQAEINGVGFYFGLQTDVYREGVGSTGKGVIYSRWETLDLANTAPAPGGWASSASTEGDFVGIRMNYAWHPGSYRLRIAPASTDAVGDWYGVWIYDKSKGWAETYLGALRFPSVPQHQRGIKNGWVTWTELYYKAIQQTPVPDWHVSIDGVYASDALISPIAATSRYSHIEQTDIYYDPATGCIHFLVGPRVVREHPAGQLF